MPWGRFVVTERARTVRELRRRIPRDASLCASYRLASHFTDQADLYVARDVPGQHGVTYHTLLQTQYVLLDLYDNWVGLPITARYRNEVLRSGRHGAIFARDGFLIFQRGAKGIDLDARYKLQGEARPQHRYGETLAGFATLLGYDAKPTGTGVELTLYWRCEKETAEDFAVQLVVPAAKGEEPKQIMWRHLPADGLLPTWAWKRGEIIVDRVTIPGLSLPRDGRPLILNVVLEPIKLQD
jgi:hypothetical protein